MNPNKRLLMLYIFSKSCTPPHLPNAAASPPALACTPPRISVRRRHQIGATSPLRLHRRAPHRAAEPARLCTHLRPARRHRAQLQPRSPARVRCSSRSRRPTRPLARRRRFRSRRRRSTADLLLPTRLTAPPDLGLKPPSLAAVCACRRRLSSATTLERAPPYPTIATIAGLAAAHDDASRCRSKPLPPHHPV